MEKRRTFVNQTSGFSQTRETYMAVSLPREPWAVEEDKPSGGSLIVATLGGKRVMETFEGEL